MGDFVVLLDRSHTLLSKSVASKVIQVFQSASVWQQLVVTMFQQDVKMSQDVNRLIAVLQDQAGHNVLCFICHTKESVCGNGTGSMGGRHVGSAVGGLGDGGSTSSSTRAKSWELQCTDIRSISKGHGGR